MITALFCGTLPYVDLLGSAMDSGDRQDDSQADTLLHVGGGGHLRWDKKLKKSWNQG